MVVRKKTIARLFCFFGGGYQKPPQPQPKKAKAFAFAAAAAAVWEGVGDSMRNLLLAAAALATAAPPDNAFLIACAQGLPECAHVWRAPVPPFFNTTLRTQHGAVSILVNTSAAPAMAQRFFVLQTLGYARGGPFYRVLAAPGRAFVAQWGYRGDPAVDAAWVALRTSNATAPALLSNTRGTVAFGTSEVANSGTQPGCTAPLCSRGFSVELFVNLADNSRLDAMGFSPFGVVTSGMEAVDALFAGYGECADLCAGEAPPSPFCVPRAGGGFAGVNFTRFLAEGSDAYLRPAFPLLDYVG